MCHRLWPLPMAIMSVAHKNGLVKIPGNIDEQTVNIWGGEKKFPL